MTKRTGSAAWIAVACLTASLGQARAALPPSVQDSFQLGSGKGVLCRATNSLSAATTGMFDRGYSILCRDAAAPIGKLYALRTDAAAATARLDALRGAGVPCDPARPAAIADVPGATERDCKLAKEGVGYRVYTVTRGRTTYVAEGLQGYDSAVRIGFRTIVADKAQSGDIEAATTEVTNPAAFARVQAGTLDPAQLLAEGYRRNNSGSYADAAEFFDALNDRQRATALKGLLGEYVANQALQRSNLGEFDQADALFGRLLTIPTNDPVQLRLRRNFLALHLLNEGHYDEAKAELTKPIAPVGANIATREGAPIIDSSVAAQLNADAANGLAGSDSSSLTPVERGEILDAQAEQIRGTVTRIQGDVPGAEALLNKSLADLDKVREGRVTALARLRAQTYGELSACAETRGDNATAERLLRAALAMIVVEYPNTAAEWAAKARLAGYLARHGQKDVALGLYRDVVQSVVQSGGSAIGLQRLLAPYFALLTDEMPHRPALAADFFAVSQTLVRPGVADTQAVLARELSGGSDEASRLFRQSVTLNRDVERTRIDVGRLQAVAQTSAASDAALATAKASLTKLEADQVATQASLSAFPRYRAVSASAMTLAELETTLGADEAYLKLAVVGPDLYALFVRHDGAIAYRLPIDTATLDETVTALRDTITKDVGGTYQTVPFDVAKAHELFLALLGPAMPRLAGVRQLVFEPDGALLRLPIDLLVTDDASVAAYTARAADPKGDPFDFTGVAWLGRSVDVSTAVSPQAFRDIRRVRPSEARYGYLGLGDNAPVVGTTSATAVARTRSISARGAIDCSWPLSAWSDPISPTELYAAQKVVGGTGDDVVTGAAFSDTALIERKDLADYRILHFATHGLVTAPRPECPARPALLTSFGPALPDGRASDGLLTFREVFDLHLDADLVILSACDTAGQASVAATREAGETSGGGSSLDGLVRAFVGAGGRAVLASHWPVPNDYKATERLITGLFGAPRGTSIGEAMRASQLKLMDDKDTSHPYYWAAFALIGDGARPLLRASAPATAAAPSAAEHGSGSATPGS